MIKQILASYFYNKKNAQYCCLSTDELPDYLKNGDEVYFIDTGKRYYYDEVTERLYEANDGSGSGGSGNEYTIHVRNTENPVVTESGSDIFEAIENGRPIFFELTYDGDTKLKIPASYSKTPIDDGEQEYYQCYISGTNLRPDFDIDIIPVEESEQGYSNFQLAESPYDSEYKYKLILTEEQQSIVEKAYNEMVDLSLNVFSTNDFFIEFSSIGLPNIIPWLSISQNPNYDYSSYIDTMLAESLADYWGHEEGEGVKYEIKFKFGETEFIVRPTSVDYTWEGEGWTVYLDTNESTLLFNKPLNDQTDYSYNPNTENGECVTLLYNTDNKWRMNVSSDGENNLFHGYAYCGYIYGEVTVLYENGNLYLTNPINLGGWELYSDLTQVIDIDYNEVIYSTNEYKRVISGLESSLTVYLEVDNNGNINNLSVGDLNLSGGSQPTPSEDKNYIIYISKYNNSEYYLSESPSEIIEAINNSKVISIKYYEEEEQEIVNDNDETEYVTKSNSYMIPSSSLSTSIDYNNDKYKIIGNYAEPDIIPGEPIEYIEWLYDYGTSFNTSDNPDYNYMLYLTSEQLEKIKNGESKTLVITFNGDFTTGYKAYRRIPWFEPSEWLQAPYYDYQICVDEIYDVDLNCSSYPDFVQAYNNGENLYFVFDYGYNESNNIYLTLSASQEDCTWENNDGWIAHYDFSTDTFHFKKPLNDSTDYTIHSNDDHGYISLLEYGDIYSITLEAYKYGQESGSDDLLIGFHSIYCDNPFFIGVGNGFVWNGLIPEDNDVLYLKRDENESIDYLSLDVNETKVPYTETRPGTPTLTGLNIKTIYLELSEDNNNVIIAMNEERLPTVDDELSSTSENPVQNKVINTSLEDKLSVNQGSENAGKFLVVGQDGNIETVTISSANGVSF